MPTPDTPTWSDLPRPGSPEAKRRGCRCPRIDNAHGRGHHGNPGVWVMAQNCPLHGWQKEAPDAG